MYSVHYYSTNQYLKKKKEKKNFILHVKYAITEPPHRK